jgi:hypothetical protein
MSADTECFLLSGKTARRYASDNSYIAELPPEYS